MKTSLRTLLCLIVSFASKFAGIYNRNGEGRKHLRMRPNRYLNKKRSFDKIGDKVGDMDKTACQQKRSFD